MKSLVVVVPHAKDRKSRTRRFVTELRKVMGSSGTKLENVYSLLAEMPLTEINNVLGFELLLLKPSKSFSMHAKCYKTRVEYNAFFKNVLNLPVFYAKCFVPN